MPALPETMTRERAGRPSTASPSVSRSFDDFQGGSSARGQSRGVCRCLPQIRPYQFQFAGVFDAPRQRPVSRSLLPRVIGQHLPGCAFAAAPGLFIQHGHRGSSRQVVHSTVRQQSLKHFADGSHLNSLSNPSSFAGFKTSRKELQGRGNSVQERGFFFQGNRRHD